MPNELGPPPNETEKIWTAMGLSPQTFPIYYPMGTQPFRDGAGNPSGAVGATARLEKDLSNFAHMFMGLRIDNVYTLPEDANADAVQMYRTMKEWIDAEQTVTINLAQQNVTADRLFQRQLTGTGGINWHPFPAPFPMAGANNITVDLQRVTSYPLLSGDPVLPEVRISILAAVLRSDMQTVAPHRRHQ